MRPVVESQYEHAFAEAALSTHLVRSWVDVYYGGALVADGVPVTAGSVTNDAGSARARLDCTISWPERLIGEVEDYLSPAGFELAPWRGIVLGGGVEAMVPLGVFPIQRSSMTAVGGQTRIQALDRSQFISDAVFESPYRVASGGNYNTAIAIMLLSRYTPATTNFPETEFTTPVLTFDEASDPWTAAQQMSASIGNRLFLDSFGAFTQRTEPSLEDEPVFSIEVARNLIDANRDLDRGSAFNKVICRGRNASNGAEYVGEATDPSYSTPFGQKPKIERREYFASNDQCAVAAAAILAASRGIESSFDFTILPDPRLEVGDVVRVYCPQLNTNETHIIQSITVSLGTEAITGTTRGQRLA